MGRSTVSRLITSLTRQAIFRCFTRRIGHFTAFRHFFQIYVPKRPTIPGRGRRNEPFEYVCCQLQHVQ